MDTSPAPLAEPSAKTSPRDAPDADQLTVVDCPADQRYELHFDGERVGVADYSLADDVMTIAHVETEPVHRGKNFAARLMAGILDDVRSRDLTVRPLCSYADAYMRRHPDTTDLRAS